MSISSARHRLEYGTYSVMLVLVLLIGLIGYKATTSLSALQSAASNGAPTARVDLLQFGEAGGVVPLATRSMSYLAIVWPALVFGILISGAVRTFVSPGWLADMVGRGPLRAHLAAGVAGVPLMLCSCCAAPIFSAVYERCSRVGPSLAVMLAAPSLNPAALILTFMFFAPHIAWSRLVLALAAVFGGTLLTARIAQGGLAPPSSRLVPSAEAQSHPIELIAAFLRSCAHVTARTLPLILVGILAAMLVASRVPPLGSSPGTIGVAVAVAALIAVPIALPTFFEVPLALTLLASGAPAGAALAILFAGPAINLPSLLTIAHATSWKVSVIVAAMVWLLAFVGGMLAS